MKILVAIKSSENATKLSNSTLRWAARAGFDVRIFIPNISQFRAYQEAIDNANYNWYLDLKYTNIVIKTSAKLHAKRQGYALIVYLPDDMHKWNSKVNHDTNVMEFAIAVGEARTKFSKDPKKQTEKFYNGAIMKRV